MHRKARGPLPACGSEGAGNGDEDGLLPLELLVRVKLVRLVVIVQVVQGDVGNGLAHSDGSHFCSVQQLDWCVSSKSLQTYELGR